MRIAFVSVLILLLPPQTYGARQEYGGEAMSSIEGAGGRVVFPTSLHIDAAEVRELLAALENQEPLAGLPAKSVSDVRVTISLVPGHDARLDAWSFPDQRVIAFPVDKALTWEEAKAAQGDAS